MEFFRNLFGGGSKKVRENGNAVASPAAPPRRTVTPGAPATEQILDTESTVFYPPEKAKEHEEELAKVKKKSEESHRDLTETIQEFNRPRRKEEEHGELQAPKA
jgi:hypothetical protein